MAIVTTTFTNGDRIIPLSNAFPFVRSVQADFSYRNYDTSGLVVLLQVVWIRLRYNEVRVGMWYVKQDDVFQYVNRTNEEFYYVRPVGKVLVPSEDLLDKNAYMAVSYVKSDLEDVFMYPVNGFTGVSGGAYRSCSGTTNCYVRPLSGDPSVSFVPIESCTRAPDPDNFTGSIDEEWPGIPVFSLI